MFQLEKRHQLVLLVMAACLLFGAGYKYALLRQGDNRQELVVEAADTLGAGEAEPAGKEEGEQKTEDIEDIVVHVAGEVKKPGVYRLPPGSRVVDAVNLAQPTEHSALDYLNLAAPLQDGQQIMVYSLEEIKQRDVSGGIGNSSPLAAAGSGTSYGTAPGRININNAGRAELESLPGIGPSLAQRIIDYRAKHGPFLSIEDVQNVSGIGEKRFEQIRELICVD